MGVWVSRQQRHLYKLREKEESGTKPNTADGKKNRKTRGIT
jgi:hypothetical protein